MYRFFIHFFSWILIFAILAVIGIGIAFVFSLNVWLGFAALFVLFSAVLAGYGI